MFHTVIISAVHLHKRPASWTGNPVHGEEGRFMDKHVFKGPVGKTINIDSGYGLVPSGNNHCLNKY